MARETPTWQQALAKRISDGILHAGYTSKDQFARSIALPRMTLHKLLKGELDPKVSTLLKIADGLDSTLEALLAQPESLRRVGKEIDGSALETLKKPGRRKLRTLSVKLTVSGEDLPGWLQEAFKQASIPPEVQSAKFGPKWPPEFG
jgi:transcriptional regulator with XRE-family HTH domain